MRSLFPIRRPRAGIALSPQAVSLVEVSKGWRGGQRIRRVVTEALPAGLLKADPVGTNVSDASALIKIAQSVLKNTRERTLSVSLPLSCAHVGLFAFDQFASRVQDQRAVIRWRFKEDERVAVGDADIAYRVFEERSIRKPSAAKPMTYVLAVAMKPQILEQYQHILHEAGIIPVSIGWSILQTFDLARACMQPAEETFFLYEDVDAWTLIAVRESTPVYMRHRTGKSFASDRHAQLRRTLQFYDDLFPHHPLGEAAPVASLYAFGPREDTQLESVDGHHSPTEAATFVSCAAYSWQIAIKPSSWMRHPRGKSLNALTEWSAYAGIVTV